LRGPAVISAGISGNAFTKRGIDLLQAHIPRFPETIVLPTARVVAQPVSAEHPPPSAVDAEGQAGQADEGKAKSLRIAEYYRPERYPEDAC